MVRAYHLIFCAYGFWLPNDPRGSWSEFVRKWELFRFGEATKVNTRQSLANAPHDHRLRKAAKTALRYPPVSFDGRQALAIARGFAEAQQRTDLHFYACSILPEHVHVVVSREKTSAEALIERLKSFGTKSLNHERLHPLATPSNRRSRPSPWSGGGWKVFLDTDAQILKAVDYVERNPGKEGRPPQRWPFVHRPW